MSRDRPPSMQWYPRDILADAAYQALSWEERGHYRHGLDQSWNDGGFGIGTEEQWRVWMAYDTRGWARHREAHAKCFRILPSGLWKQARMVRERSSQKAYKDSARRGGLKAQAQRSPEQRSEAGKKAAKGRWDAKRMRTPFASDANTASASAIKGKALVTSVGSSAEGSALPNGAAAAFASLPRTEPPSEKESRLRAEAERQRRALAEHLERRP